jgi:iron complex transport system permease protein
MAKQKAVSLTDYDKNFKSKYFLIAAFAVFLVLVTLFSLSLGRYHVPVTQVFKILTRNVFHFSKTWTDQMENVVLRVRLPRIICAAIVGSSLSLSGGVYQGVFNNPLVSPDILGVSSGACVGASLAIISHLSAPLIQLSALVTGILAVIISMGISRLFRNSSPVTLVLSGVIVSALASSILSLCQFMANVYEELPAIVFWTMGSLATASKSDIGSVLPASLVFGTVILCMRWRINLLSLSWNDAQSLGIDVKLMRGLAILSSTILTASAVCISGTIGWVGLIIPHICRLIVGSDNTYVLPASALLGASFMVVVDTLARFLTSSEIPISIITGLIGTPLFVFIIMKRRLSL